MISVSVLDLTTLAWAIWAAGGLLLVALTLAKVAPRSIAQMWKLFASEGVFIAVATLPFLIGGIAVPLVLAAISLRSGWECVYATSRAWKLPPAARRGSQIFGAGFMAALAAAGWFFSVQEVLLLSAILLATCLAAHLVRARSNGNVGAAFASGGALLDAGAFPGIPLALFAHIAHQPEAYPLIVLAFIHVEIFDSLAVLGGKLVGKTPLFGALSPNKTVEGFVTGLCALGVLSIGYILIAGGGPVLAWTALIVAGAIAAVAGDLSASFHKRAAGLKDYPAIYGPQGGLLDMTDAWIAAVPLTAAAAWLLGVFPA